MAELPQQFLGSFKLEKSEMFDEYLEKKGVPWVARKMMGMASITKVFRINEEKDASYILDNRATIKNLSWAFKLGEPFESEGFDGKIHKITFALDGDKLLESHVRIEDKNDPGETYSYHVDGEYLILQMEHDGVTAKRYLKKVP